MPYCEGAVFGLLGGGRLLGAVWPGEEGAGVVMGAEGSGLTEGSA